MLRSAIIHYRFPFWLRPFLQRGVAGITLGRRVYVDGTHPGVDRIVRHELVHVRQIGEIGVARFYGKWIWEYIALRARGLPSHEAYRRISFEAEAFAAEGMRSL